MDDKNNTQNDSQELKNERLLAIRNELFGNNNREMAKALNTNENNLSLMINNKRDCAMSIINSIATNLPQVNLNWFIAGRGSMLVSQAPAVNEDEASYNAKRIEVLKSELDKANRIIDNLLLNCELLKEKINAK